MQRIKKMIIFYFKTIKKLDYYTITINGKVETYVFRKMV